MSNDDDESYLEVWNFTLVISIFQYLNHFQYFSVLPPIYPSYISNITDYDAVITNLAYSNYTAFTQKFNFYIRYVNQNKVKKAIHVGDKNYVGLNTTIIFYLREDFFRSNLGPKTTLIDNNFKVLVFNGNFDILFLPTANDHLYDSPSI